MQGTRAGALQTGRVPAADGSMAGTGRYNEASAEHSIMGTGTMDRGNTRLPSDKWNAMSGNLNPSDVNARSGGWADGAETKTVVPRASASEMIQREDLTALPNVPMTLEQYMAKQQVNEQEE